MSKARRRGHNRWWRQNVIKVKNVISPYLSRAIDVHLGSYAEIDWTKMQAEAMKESGNFVDVKVDPNDPTRIIAVMKVSLRVIDFHLRIDEGATL